MPTPRIVFLDTQVFEQELYDTDSLRLSRLRELVKEGYAKVVLTEITQREIVERIRETTKVAIQAIKRCRKEREAGILRQLKPMFDQVFAKLDSTALSKQIEEKFAAFCKELRIDVLPLSLANKSFSSLVDDYFESRPPFGEGRKRSEFPDAIAGSILKTWCENEKKTAIVVTGDADWTGLCGKDGLTHLGTLVEFLGLFPDATLAQELIVGLRGPSFAVLRNHIVDSFEGLSFFARDVDGDVEEVSDVDVSFGDIVIVHAKDGQAVAEIECDITFLASVNYLIEGTGVWDPEDEVLMFGQRTTDEIEDSTTLTVEVNFEYDEEDPTCMTSLEDVSLGVWDVRVDCGSIGEW